MNYPIHDDLEISEVVKFETVGVRKFGSADDKSWEDLLRLVGLMMNNLDEVGLVGSRGQQT